MAPSRHGASLLLLLGGLCAGYAAAYQPTQSPLSCTNLIAVSCVAKGLQQCCVAGGDCCPDGSCCGVGQTCLSSGSGGYTCCNTSYDCPNRSTPPASGSTPFHAQIPCSPAEGDSWYCDYGQSCGFSSGSCIGVANHGSSGTSGTSGTSGSSGSSGSSGDSSAASSSSSPSSPSASPSSGSAPAGSSSSQGNAASGHLQRVGAMDALALVAAYLLA